MSFDALSWAAKQRPGSSGAKLVLLGLAECANRTDARAFPSLAELVEFSSLDRKSVIANLDKLEAGGFIRDTGERVGRTRQIKVYTLSLQSVPETEPSQKRNSTVNSAKSTKNGTRNLSEPTPSEAKASSGDGASAPAVKPEHVIEAWNAMADQSGVHKARMTPDRRKKLSAFIRQHEVSDITEAIWAVPASPFLCGENDRGWKADLDFFMRPARFAKLLEGSYG